MGGLRYIAGFEDRPPVRTGFPSATRSPPCGRDRRADGATTTARSTAERVRWSTSPSRADLRHDGKHGSGTTCSVSSASAPATSCRHHPPPSTPAPMAATYRSAPTATRSSAALMQAIGRDDLASDPRLASNDWARCAPRRTLWGYRPLGRLAALEEVLAVLARAEVPASRIYSAEDMFRDPQFLAREMFLSARLPDGKPFRMPGIVPEAVRHARLGGLGRPGTGRAYRCPARRPGLRQRAHRHPAPGRRHLNGTRSPSSVLRGQSGPLPYPAREGVIRTLHEHGAIRQEPLHRRAPSA